MPLSLQVLLPSQNPVLGEGTGENKCCILKRFLTNENHKRELVPEISSSASLTQLSLDRGTVLHTVLGEPDTGMQAAASLRALQPPPQWYEATESNNPPGATPHACQTTRSQDSSSSILPGRRAPRTIGPRARNVSPDSQSKALASGLPLYRSTPACSGNGLRAL